MSERILKALMHLFAIVAEVDIDEQGNITTKGRAVVELFLKQQLNLEQVEAYLKVFDEFLVSHHQITSKKKEGQKKRTSLGSVKVLKICKQINEELEQRQKIIVLVRLIEYVSRNKQVTPQELEFITTVSESFNITNEEFQRSMSFVTDPVEHVPETEFVLVIDCKSTPPNQKVRHFNIENIEGQLRVLEIPSVNMYALKYYGTSELYLNGQIIHNDRLYVLTPGSSIRSSKVKPIYYSDIVSSFMTDLSKEKIVFTANKIQYRFRTGNIGLRDVNIAEESGTLVGIMGGSGAGKSTLLMVLNGIETPTSGSVKINGIDIHREKDKAEGIIGFIPQDDLLMEDLTVYQNLFYAAKLCFNDLNDEEISKRALNLLGDLGLYEPRNLKVGSPLDKYISGGQRKRLNIALELIREPSVLFVDEPTSGLSSRDSENIMDLLKELALKGKLVFVVIHQPSSDIYKMFDGMVILDVGGYPIYYGNPVDAVVYFKKIVEHVNSDESECLRCGNVNPEQIFNIIESKVVDEYGNLTRTRKVSPKEWNNFYREKIESNGLLKTLEEVESKPVKKEIAGSLKIPNPIKQFMVFLTRDVLSKIANTQYMVINLLEAPLLGFILSWLIKYYNADVSNVKGYIFRENENIMIYMFMSVVVALFLGLMVSAEEIIKDRKILKREAFLNLSKASYLISKITILFILSAVQSIAFILVGNTILEIKGMYIDYFLILFSVSCFANILGLNVSASFNSAITIYILIPFLIIPQLLLSGVMVKFDKLNPVIIAHNSVPVWGEVMVTRWAYEALAVNQFKNNKYESRFYDIDKKRNNISYKKNFWISKLRGLVDRVQNNMVMQGKETDIENDLKLLYNELSFEAKVIQPAFQELDNLVPGKFNEAIAQNVKDFLTHLNRYYIFEYNRLTQVKDSMIMSYQKTPEAKQKYIELEDDYKNDALEDLVINKNEMSQTIEVENQIIQKTQMIFVDPVRSGYIRAHFYAPRKNLFGRFIDTFWVNIIVIWGMSSFLIITLYFDILKKFIDSFGLISERFTKKKK
ncbi:MAG: ATP-binding cassette domain-containing protein [Bacteroidetes bacterium]|nr:ATP-binding cassette domain-containing protein [Bacteroidota bacterium]